MGDFRIFWTIYATPCMYGVHDDVTASNQVVSKLSASCLQVVSMSRCRMTGTMSMTDPGPDNQIARHGLMLASDDKICKFFAPVSPRPAPHRAALRCKVAAPPAPWTAFPFFVRLLLPILVSNWYYECGVDI